MIPHQDDTMDRLQGATIFSTLDLARGFHQQEVHEDHRHPTTFSTRRGLWEWCRVPFSLKNAPASFQRLMNLTLQRVCWRCCLLYLDGIIVFSKSFDEHLQHLQQVFDCLRPAGLRLRSEKCHFAATSINFLGHIISKDGVRIDCQKISSVQTHPQPKKVSQLGHFLGITNYH